MLLSGAAAVAAGMPLFLGVGLSLNPKYFMVMVTGLRVGFLGFRV